MHFGETGKILLYDCYYLNSQPASKKSCIIAGLPCAIAAPEMQVELEHSPRPAHHVPGEGCLCPQEGESFALIKVLHGLPTALLLLFFPLFEYNFLMAFAFINTVYCLVCLCLTRILSFQPWRVCLMGQGGGRMGSWLQQVQPFKTQFPSPKAENSKAEYYFWPLCLRDTPFGHLTKQVVPQRKHS